MKAAEKLWKHLQGIRISEVQWKRLTAAETTADQELKSIIESIKNKTEREREHVAASQEESDKPSDASSFEVLDLMDDLDNAQIWQKMICGLVEDIGQAQIRLYHRF